MPNTSYNQVSNKCEKDFNKIFEQANPEHQAKISNEQQEGNSG